jgi:hypothetical protein
MLTEVKVDSPNRWFRCQNFLPEDVMRRVKEDVKVFMADRNKDDLYNELIDWRQRPNEIVVLTMYAYADIELPKRFDTVFEIENPDNFEEVSVQIRYAIFNGYAPVDLISHGHKHILVLEFIDSVPAIFNLLQPFNDKTRMSASEGQLGLCSKSDFQAIKNTLKSKID